MTPRTAQELLDAVLKLPANDCAHIVREVVRSLGDESAQDDVDDAWRAEIERRVEDILENRVELIPARKVMEDLRAELRAMRESPCRAADERRDGPDQRDGGSS